MLYTMDTDDYITRPCAYSITVTRALQAVVHLLAQTRDNLQYYNIYG